MSNNTMSNEVFDRFELARLFLRRSHASIDPALPSLLAVLQEVGAPECWHKHGSFYEHLVDVYRILKLWNVPDAVARCGLFHSSYSNSYVNLAIFQPNVDRQKVRDLIGNEAEALVHLFCVVPRQQLIHDMLLFKYSDEDLVSALEELQSFHRGTESERDYGDFRNVTENEKMNGQGINECACKKTNDVHYDARLHDNKGGDKMRINFPIIPPEGITVSHIRTGEDLKVSRRLIAIFLVLTMADFIDQLYSWQDSLFENEDGRLEFRGNTWTALWPGDGKPGLWMTAVSRMGVLLNILVKEEELERQFSMKTEANGHGESLQGGFLDVKLVIPPLFNNCSVILTSLDQIKARDLYWEAVCMDIKEGSLEEAEGLLLKACNCNPWIGEPYLLLAQIYLSKGSFEVALANAKEGLRLLIDWGTNWDKRMSWEGWVAWARVLELNARENTWPKSSWGMINLGLVKLE